MRNLFLMSLFGLCMMVATSGSLTNITIATPAYATDSNNDNAVEFKCPTGIATCYNADGEAFSAEDTADSLDVNNLPATAAGVDDHSDNIEVFVSAVAPVHFRSF